MGACEEEAEFIGVLIADESMRFDYIEKVKDEKNHLISDTTGSYAIRDWGYWSYEWDLRALVSGMNGKLAQLTG